MKKKTLPAFAIIRYVWATANDRKKQPNKNNNNNNNNHKTT